MDRERLGRVLSSSLPLLYPRELPADIPLALAWAAKQSYALYRGDVANGATAVFQEAWKHKDEPAIRASLIEVFKSLISGGKYRRAMEQELTRWLKIDQGIATRRAFIFDLLNAMEIQEQPTELELTHIAKTLVNLNLVVEKDAQWCADQANLAGESTVGRLLALLLKQVAFWDMEPGRELTLQLLLDAPWTQKFLFPRSVDLESDSARAQQQHFHDEALWKAQIEAQQGPPMNVEEIETQLQSVLNQPAKGDSSGWRRAVRVMQFAEFKNDGFAQHNLDMFKCWTDLNISLKMQLFTAAESFLRYGKPSSHQSLLNSDDIKAADIHGFAALALLIRQAPHRAAKLSDSIWQKWAATIISGSHENTTEEMVLGLPVRQALFQRVPDEMLDAYHQQIAFYEQRDFFLAGQQLKDIWCAEVEQFVLSECRAVKSQNVWLQLLSILLQQGSEEGTAYAMATALSSSKRASSASVLLLQNRKNWPPIYERLQRDKSFATTLLVFLVEGRHYVNLCGEATANLFRLVVEKYPYSAISETGSDNIAQDDLGNDFKNALLNQLVQFGTPASLDSLKELKHDFPELTWLNVSLEQAMAVTERRSWQPSTAESLLKLLGSQDRRIVDSPSQLLQIIQESLGRMMHNLQNQHTPLVNYLWNEWEDADGHHWKPKMEDHLSDWVKAHLQSDLIDRQLIVNREPEIRRGEFSDIVVSAVRPASLGQSANRIDVIIETKGCWHTHILSAMDTQLAGTYLRDSKASVGLYLVGWYHVPGFYENKPSRTEDINALETKLAAQAKKLSQTPILIESRVLDLRFRNSIKRDQVKII